jgi:hypothetical protein
MQPDATRKSRFRAATARECPMALRATKSNEDARSRWGGRPRPRTGALAGPPAAGRQGVRVFNGAVAGDFYTTCNRIPTAVLQRLHRLESIISPAGRSKRRITKRTQFGPLFSTKANQESQFPIAGAARGFIGGSDEMQRNASRNCKMARGCRRCRSVAALAAAARLQQPFAT